MSAKRKVHSDEFKAKVALEAARGARTLSELSSMFSVHPTVISHWKSLLLKGAPAVFSSGRPGREMTEEEMTSPLYEEIGRLKVEVDFLKKKLCSSPGR
jgi:transposase-like protein